jgi:hypothetical protein
MSNPLLHGMYCNSLSLVSMRALNKVHRNPPLKCAVLTVNAVEKTQVQRRTMSGPAAAAGTGEVNVAATTVPVATSELLPGTGWALFG